ncbi:MAG: hypothetical protein J6D57_01570, partial [Mogibacterium sp.]|nr:hypothetical protein [Mogibacterium sp.]
DIKRAAITAYTMDGDTAVPLDDAFYITGYSANETTSYSTDQVRIEGSFKVANLDYEIDSAKYNGVPYVSWPDQNYVNKVHQDRLANKVYYSVTAVKPITFNLVDPKKGQLYDSEGNKLTVTVDVAFSASFNYFDEDNECPPVQWDLNNVLNGLVCTHDMSGMDFTLGGKPDQDHKVVAIEITKLVVDENGNRIKSNDAGKNTFYIYKNPSATSDSVKDLNIGKATETPDYSGYVEQHSKSLTVGDDGMGNIYDYDVTPGMYYISEDPTSIKDKITDTSGQEWDYKETYFLTEYAWRNHDNDNFMHVSETYSGKSGSYSSVPEILGNHPSYDGTEEFTNDFLEFYVYNVYESPKVDVPVIKAWPAFEGDEYDWTATFRLQWAPLYPDESTPSTSFQDVSPQQTVTVTKAKMDGLTQEMVNRYLDGDDTLTAAEIAKVEAVTFKNLPKYGTDAQGNTYRIQYSLDEISYTVTDSASGVVQYSWDEDNGYNTGDEESHYLPFYIHDAGETISSNTDDQNEADENYYVQVTNATKQIREKEYINLNLDKQWDLDNDGTMDTLDDTYWAEFELKRYVRTEYRDL